MSPTDRSRRVPPEFERMPASKIELAARISAQRERLIAQRQLYQLEKSGAARPRPASGGGAAPEAAGRSPAARLAGTIAAMAGAGKSGVRDAAAFPRSRTMQLALAHPALAVAVLGLAGTALWPLLARVGPRRLLRWFGWTVPALVARLAGLSR